MTNKTLRIITMFLVAGFIIGGLHVGAEALVSDGISAPEMPNESWLGWLLNTLKNTIIDIIKQAFMYVHQTILLAITMWLLRDIRAKWLELSPKLYNSLDSLMEKTEIEKRETLKTYINKVVMAAIEAVEATTLAHNAPFLPSEQHEALATKELQSKEKAATALALILKDLVENGLDKIALKHKPLDAFLQELLETIEKQLLEQQRLSEIPNESDITTSLFFASKQRTSLNVNVDRYAKTTSLNIQSAKATLPSHYVAAINHAIATSFK